MPSVCLLPSPPNPVSSWRNSMIDYPATWRKKWCLVPIYVSYINTHKTQQVPWKHNEPWSPPSYYSHHIIPPPALRHRTISQQAMQQHYIVKTRKTYYSYYFLAYFLWWRQLHPRKTALKNTTKMSTRHTFQPWRSPPSRGRLGAPPRAPRHTTISQDY